MVSLGTPYSSVATKLLLLGAGELGKEIAIEAQRLGVEVIAVDRYANAPAMQVAHRSHVISMLSEAELIQVVQQEKPDFIVPEIEAIATNVLIELEQQGFNIVPTALATQLTMNREGIRRLAAEKLGLSTSAYRFANTKAELLTYANQIGYPCVVKPVMSSSGKGQTIVHSENELEKAWLISQNQSRTNISSTVIVEQFIPFDYEITLLTIKHVNGVSFCDPIGHLQIAGDYRESWQPHPMAESVLAKAQQMAKQIVNALGGYGVFGVEFFIQGENVFFSEVSPRPHDTGLVTLISQDLSEFALHVRAILGLPIPAIRQYGHAASCALVANGEGDAIRYHELHRALSENDVQIRLFGKPEIRGTRRLGVILALANSIDEARNRARTAMECIEIEVLSA